MATTYQESVVGLQQLAFHTGISAKKVYIDNALAFVSTTYVNNIIFASCISAFVMYKMIGSLLKPKTKQKTKTQNNGKYDFDLSCK